MLCKMLTFLSLNCREKKIEGLTSLRVMAQNHMDILMPKLHDICLAIINEVAVFIHCPIHSSAQICYIWRTSQIIVSCF